MRALWTGTISWGLVVLPVKLGAAVTDNSVSFRQVHSADGGRIRMQRVCSDCGENVAYCDVAKGVEVSKDTTVMLTDADMDELPLATAKTISVVKFVPAAQIDPISSSHIYYMWPDGVPANAAYALLRDTMRTAKKVAICKVAIRSRERLAALSVRGNALVLTTLLWPDEIREPDMELPTGKPSVAERKMASALIEASSGDFEPDDYRDGYREALETLVAAKAGSKPVPGKRKAPASKGLDLVAALQASLDEAAPRNIRPHKAA